MESSKAWLVALIFSLMISCASAIEISSPIDNYHYDSQNVLMNATNSNIENSTDCEFFFNIDTAFNETIASNDSYSRYFSALNPTNVLEYNCTDLTSGNVVFYYEETTSSETTRMNELFAVLISFALLSIIVIFIFKF